MCVLLHVFVVSRIKKKWRAQSWTVLRSQRKSSPWSVTQEISLKSSGELNITKISSFLLLFPWWILVLLFDFSVLSFLRLLFYMHLWWVFSLLFLLYNVLFFDSGAPPSELLEMCELSLDKMGSIFADTNVYMLHMMYQAMGVCLYMQDWDGAMSYGEKIIQPYRWNHL